MNNFERLAVAVAFATVVATGDADAQTQGPPLTDDQVAAMEVINTQCREKVISPDEAREKIEEMLIPGYIEHAKTQFGMDQAAAEKIAGEAAEASADHVVRVRCLGEQPTFEIPTQ